jgi:uncharacterized protein YkwD
MYRTYLLAATALVALVTGIAATLGPAPSDKADALALGAPVSAAEASFRRHPASTTGTTVPFIEHDDDASRRITTTTSTTTTSTTTTVTTTTTAPPAANNPPATTAPKPKPTTTAARAPAPGGSYNSGFEADFAASINGLRSANGLAGLSRNSSLDGEARAWSKRMAENGSISHSNIGRFLPPWSTAGENVGSGGSVSGLFEALSNSSGHRANMLGSGYTHFGIGVWVDDSGTIWTTHVFAG